MMSSKVDPANVNPATAGDVLPYPASPFAHDGFWSLALTVLGTPIHCACASTLFAIVFAGFCAGCDGHLVNGIRDSGTDVATDSGFDAQFTDSASIAWPMPEGEELAGPLGQPASIVLQGDYLYWVNATPRSVVRMPKVGGNVEIVLKPEIPSARYQLKIAVDDTHLYFTSDDGAPFDTARRALKRIRKDGSGTSERVHPGDVRPFTFALHDGRVFWEDDPSTSIRSAALTGDIDLRIHGVGTFGVDGFAFDSAFVYWTDSRASRDSREGTGYVRRATLTAPFQDEPLFEAREEPRSPLLLGRTLYWLEGPVSGPCKIFSTQVDVMPREAVEVAALPRSASDIVTDGTSLFWGTNRSQQDFIFMLPLPSRVPKVLAREQYLPAWVAVDSDYVYWAAIFGPSEDTSNNGSIRRIAKP